MKIFTSALESQSVKQGQERKYLSKFIIENGGKLLWNLMSFYYLKNHLDNAFFVRDNSELILIDSGAHSFQFGKKVPWVEYTENYAQFIDSFDKRNVVGYFEMDIENIVGYENVLYLRKILETNCKKIIPVWHPLRGIKDYEAMCEKYTGEVVAIGGFRGTDIKDSQYLSFLKVARKYGCRVHCLGMSRTEVLNKVPFDYTDSATWMTATNMGNPFTYDGRQRAKRGALKFPKATGVNKFYQFAWNYSQFQNIQRRYHDKWKKECGD